MDLSARQSKAEAHPPHSGIDIAVVEEGEAQPGVHLVEHYAKIKIPLWRRSGIHCARNRFVRPGALRMRAAPPPEKRIRDVVIGGADHIQFVRDGVFRTGPHDLQGLVAKAVHIIARIVDIRVVEGLAPLTKKGSGDIRGYEHRGRIV